MTNWKTVIWTESGIPVVTTSTVHGCNFTIESQYVDDFICCLESIIKNHALVLMEQIPLSNLSLST